MSKPKGFVQASRARIRDPIASIGARGLWVILKSYANPSGTKCYPTIATLCTDTGMERKWVFRHLQELEDLGWIKRWKVPDGSRFPRSHYVIVDHGFPVPKKGTGASAQNGNTTYSHIPTDPKEPGWCREQDARPGAYPPHPTP